MLNGKNSWLDRKPICPLFDTRRRVDTFQSGVFTLESNPKFRFVCFELVFFFSPRPAPPVLLRKITFLGRDTRLRKSSTQVARSLLLPRRTRRRPRPLTTDPRWRRTFDLNFRTWGSGNSFPMSSR